MDVRLQYNAISDPGSSNSWQLLFRVKTISGLAMRVDHVHYTVTRKGEAAAPFKEASPVGLFPTSPVDGGGDGYYQGATSLPNPGEYEVRLEVQDGSDKFAATWPLS